MRVRLDDDLYRVDRTFLGPRGKPLPVRATYTQWVLFFVTLVVSAIGLRLLRVSFGPSFQLALTQLVIWVLICWAVAWYLRRFISTDRPLIDELMRIAQELTAHRPAKTKTVRVRLLADVEVWESWAALRPRWHLRLWWWVQRRVTWLMRRRPARVDVSGSTQVTVVKNRSGEDLTAENNPWLRVSQGKTQPQPTQLEHSVSERDSQRSELVEERV